MTREEEKYDWDSIRTQAAISVLSSLVSNPEVSEQYNKDKRIREIGSIHKVVALAAVLYADELVEALKEKARD